MSTIKTKNSRFIMKKYKLPKSSFYKMKREYKEDEKRNISGMLKKNSKFFLSVEEKQWLRNIFEPSKHPLNINIISNKLNKMLGTQPKKEKLNLIKKMLSIIVFKKGSHSTQKSVSHKILFLRSIFSSQLLEQFLNKYYIVNIDEASF